MRRPPYSPDLALLDFWLFDYIKARLVTCSDAQSLSNAITRIVGDIDKIECHKTFDKWGERMKLCIKEERRYFEHMVKKKVLSSSYFI